MIHYSSSLIWRLPLSKRIIPLLVIAFLSFSFPAHAQSPVIFSTLTVDLWPEFDRPEMLVIYKGVLSPAVSLPVEVTMRLPANAGTPTAVAVGMDAASVADVAYETKASGDWVEVTFIAALPAIQFEYYDPGLAKDGIQRTYTYQWPGDYKVDAMTVQVKHPVGSSNVQVTPAGAKTVQGGDGFLYTISEIGSVEAGTSFSIGLTYQKATDDLSVQSLDVQPSAPISPETEGRVNLSQVWPWALATLGLLLIAGGGFWYWQSGRQEPVARIRRRRKTTSSVVEIGTSENGVYCHQCGKRASSGDRFCRACGTRLRIE